MKALDPKPLYEAIGQYVIGFQWLVNKLWLAATFAQHPEQQTSDRWALLDLSLARLIDQFQSSALASVRRCQPERAPAFETELKALIDRCHDARKRRNRFIHSAYVHLEGGGELLGIFRSDIISRGAVTPETPMFDQEPATPELFKQELERAVQIGIEVGQCHMQLIHWYKPS